MPLRRPEPAPCPSRNIVQPLLKSSEHAYRGQESGDSSTHPGDRRSIHPRRLSSRLPTEALDLGSDPDIDVRCRPIGEHGADHLLERVGSPSTGPGPPGTRRRDPAACAHPRQPGRNRPGAPIPGPIPPRSRRASTPLPRPRPASGRGFAPHRQSLPPPARWWQSAAAPAASCSPTAVRRGTTFGRRPDAGANTPALALRHRPAFVASIADRNACVNTAGSSIHGMWPAFLMVSRRASGMAVTIRGQKVGPRSQ